MVSVRTTNGGQCLGAGLAVVGLGDWQRRDAKHGIAEAAEGHERQCLGEGVGDHVLGVDVHEFERSVEHTLAEHVVTSANVLGTIRAADRFGDADACLVVLVENGIGAVWGSPRPESSSRR